LNGRVHNVIIFYRFARHGTINSVIHWIWLISYKCDVKTTYRLNQTEPATFSILPCWAFFRDSVFIYFTMHIDIINLLEYSAMPFELTRLKQIFILRSWCKYSWENCFEAEPFLESAE
jgi:hypothetical protein